MSKVFSRLQHFVALIGIASASTSLTGCPPPAPPPPGPGPQSPKPLLIVGSSAPSLELFTLELGGPRGLPQLVRQQSAPRPSVAVSAIRIVGTSLYVTGGGNGGVVEQYEIDPVTPRLTLRGTVPAGDQPMSIEATAKALYVANRLSENISVYAIGTGGSLTALQTLTVPGVLSLELDGSGRFLISGDRKSGTSTARLCSHAIQTDGSLGANPSCVPILDAPQTMQATGNALFTLMYAANPPAPSPTNWVTAWLVDPNSGVISKRGADLDIGAATTSRMALSTNAQTLFVPRQGGFSTIGTSDPLTYSMLSWPPSTSSACVLPPPAPGEVLVDPRSPTLYLTDPQGSGTGPVYGPRVSALEIAANGGLQPILCESAGSKPTSMAMYMP